jgi:hypothetical protein
MERADYLPRLVKTARQKQDFREPGLSAFADGSFAGQMLL